MDWDRLPIFHTVAEAGSFTLAAKQLNASQSSISRQIRALEDSLNVTLFTRHARGLALTEEGERLFRTTRQVVQQVDEIERELIDARRKPSGPLRVTTTVSFGSMWLTRQLKDFVRHYPDIKLQLLLSDEDVDLSTRGADVAIRFHPAEHADLIQRLLVPVRHHIYAAPAYLSERGTPERPEDLDRHDLIVYGIKAPYPIKDINWILNAGFTGHRREPVLEVNNIYGVLQALEAGMGIAAVPDYLVVGNKRLVRILREVEGPTFETYFVYPQELRGSKRVLVFRDYLIERVQQEARRFVTDERERYG